MMLFGKLSAFDQTSGTGSIMPEKGGEPIRFEKGAFKWESANVPKTDTRLSYEVGKNHAGAPTAINLRTV
jgi:CspA family cold shock protein